MSTFEWVAAIACAISAAVTLLLALRRRRKDYREFLEPALAEHGLRFISSEAPSGLFNVGPFPKFEIRRIRNSASVFVISGQYSAYRIVTFQSPDGKPHELWANLDFEAFRLCRLRWRPENEADLPESARALLKEEQPGAGNGTRVVQKRSAVRLIGALSLLSSLAFLALGAFFYMRAVNFKKAAAEAQGSVIELRADSSGHEGTAYYPVIRFADKAGREHTLHSSSGTNPPAYAVGDRAPVLYDPADPEHAEINSFTGLWLFPLILGGVGALDLLTGLFLLFVVPFILRRTASPR